VNGSEVRSPCVSICVLDDHDICMGCYRSAAEITDWVMMSNDEKRDVLEKTRERFEASNPIRLV